MLWQGMIWKRIAMVIEAWPVWARTEQMPPTGSWRTWLFLGGRGAGKTRAAAEWVRERMESGHFHHTALIGPTFTDVRDVMIDGPSGLRAVASPGFEPVLEISRRRLVWPHGPTATMFSAEDPDSLRGPQFDTAWGDEFAAWKDPQATLDLLRPAMRVGPDPRVVLSTTPRPVLAVTALLGDTASVVTRGGTAANARYLPQGFIEDLENRWAGSVLARQELDGEIVDDPAGALWSRADLAAARASTVPHDFDRIVVAVDPPASAGGGADSCGVMVVARAQTDAGPIAVVLDDASSQGLLPQDWAARVVDAFHRHAADTVIAEANQGGEMVRSLIQLAGPDVPVRLVHARVGKRVRAEPVAALYARGRVIHAGHYRALEDEMCRFGAPGFTASPDRLDALVWAVSHLLLAHHAPPSARAL
jgi:phage terminase large subunit-like protein